MNRSACQAFLKRFCSTSNQQSVSISACVFVPLISDDCIKIKQHKGHSCGERLVKVEREHK